MKYLIPPTWDAASEQVDDMLDHLARNGSTLAAEMLGARLASRPTSSCIYTAYEDEKVAASHDKGARWVHDQECSAETLSRRYGDEGHPDHTITAWKFAVYDQGQPTLLGYWDWVRQQVKDSQ